MSGGLVALLDDIATLAKATASSIDDVASSAVKVSAKAVGVVIDDTAVTPQYVSGLSPKRELPIIGKIAKASLINKLVVILPVALLLTWFAPKVLPFLLIAGGAYLCFEGGEKILEALHWLPEHEDSAEDTAPQCAEDLEKSIVSSASRTDLILDGEGTPWFIDVNVIPGMTETSLLPIAAEAEGSLDDLYDALVRNPLVHP